MQTHPIPRHAVAVAVAVAVVVAAILLLPARTLAQCSDPAVPQGGFALTRVLDQLVTYKDTAKTRMDVRYPNAKPGSCGWPVVIVCHGFPGYPQGRKTASTKDPAEHLATQGYMTVAYDWRGTGDARVLNLPKFGSTGGGEPELLDLAEIVLLIDKLYGKNGNGTADVSRLGITGFSYGGDNTWKAAAWSGRTLPTNSRGINTFPKFLAAYPIAGSASDKGEGIVGGIAFKRSIVSSALISPSTVEFEPVFLAAMKSALNANAPAAFAKIWTRDPWRQAFAHLKRSVVPVMVHLQWNSDRVEEGIRALDAMPKTTPTRAFLSAFKGHDEPHNPRQEQQTRVFAQRWFDRFLKGIKNQVETEPRFVTGVVPETLALYKNPNTLLRHRYSPTWGPTGTNRLKYYLRQGKVLSTKAPTTAESPETIKHVVNSGWTWTRFLSGGGKRNDVMQAFVWNATDYDTPLLKDPLEIVGSPSVTLEVSPQASASDYQLHCALYQVDANGAERYLQAGVALVKGNSKAQRLTVDVNDIHAYVPAGDKLRLRIENLTRRYRPNLPSGVFRYHTVPYFKNADVDIEHTKARPSWFEIPVAKTIQPSLTSATLNFDTRAPANIVFHLDGTPRRSGGLYQLAFGVTGISPGTPLGGGVTALLNVDAVTHALLPLNGTGFLPGGSGTLNQAGIAAPQPLLALRGVPSLGAFVGLRLNAIAVVLSNNRLLASNPLDVFFR